MAETKRPGVSPASKMLFGNIAGKESWQIRLRRAAWISSTLATSRAASARTPLTRLARAGLTIPLCRSRCSFFSRLRRIFGGASLSFALIALRLALGRLRGREAGIDVVGIVVEIDLIGALAFPRSIHGLLGRGDDAEVMLGVLQIVLGHYRIARRLGVAGQLQILFGDMGGVAAHLHVRTIAFVIARQRIDMLASAIPAALPVLVLVRSHRVALSNSKS